MAEQDKTNGKQDDGKTPFERFDDLMTKLLSVPKEELDEQRAEYKREKEEKRAEYERERKQKRTA